MRYDEFLRVVEAGGRPTVECGPAIDDAEGYLEAGMRARVVDATISHDHVSLRLDAGPFDDHNRRFETANYFDAQDRCVLSARDAGHYPEGGIVRVYLSPPGDGTGLGDRDLASLFTIVEDGASPLYARFLATGEPSYTACLEALLLRPEDSIEATVCSLDAALARLTAVVRARIGGGEISLSLNEIDGQGEVTVRWSRLYSCCQQLSDERVQAASSLGDALLGVLAWEDQADARDERESRVCACDENTFHQDDATQSNGSSASASPAADG